MTAKYATTCAVCASDIRPGVEIAKSGSAWAHERCAGPTAATTAARPARSAPRPEMPAADGALEVWTDGACSGNPGPGGWGALLTVGGRTRELSGGEPVTTNNRMELTAAIMALEALNKPCKVELHTDSQYVKQGITQWISGWKAKGWRTADKSPVKNADLWQRLDQARARHDVDWRWVKGHAGHVMNERADELARRGMLEILGER